MKKFEVILGLGSNIGNRRNHLRKAIAELAEYIENIHISSIYESEALLPENAPPEWNTPFCNMAIAGATSLAPHDLLRVVKQIEKKLGRNKIGHWCPREIDIDILAMEDLIIEEENLSIPHKELLKRDFALVPFAEIVPEWIHPIIKKTIKELSANLPASNIKKITKPKLVGIINVTPDSFSDGGENILPQAAIANIKRLIAEGADIIDIGAESTRPNATAISQEEEWRRIEPVFAGLGKISVPISIDTRYAGTAKKALLLGASWINDVSGFANPEIIEAVRNSNCKLVVMHSLSVPADKNIILPLGYDPVQLLLDWAKERFAELGRAGISRDRIIFDPGIGFGKSAEQSLVIIKNVARFKELGVSILIGHSRKSFMGKETGDDATIEISQFLAENSVDYLRVHNVRRHKLEVL